MTTPTSNQPPQPNLGQPIASDPPLPDQSGDPSAPFDPPLDPAIKTIQPGGGVVMSIELAWGRCRRWLLRRFRPGYVKRMEALRQGQRGPLPFEPVDPRDLKYYRNQPTYWWPVQDDPFAWRDRLPFVRAGLAELILIGGGFAVLTGVLVTLALTFHWLWWPVAIAAAVLTTLVIWFFRSPDRPAPGDAGTVVSPADGKLVQIDAIDDPVLGKCVQIGIFLSIFNVHANRASLAGRVVAIRYRPGKFLNALRPESAQENENLDLILETTEIPAGRFRIRQITGQFARRIVCWTKPGETLQRGEMYGMIKLGSRTELVIPADPNLEITAAVGQKVSAGSSVLARYLDPSIGRKLG